MLAWYTPMALGGIIIALCAGLLMHLVPITLLLLISALFWVLAPALFSIYIHLHWADPTSWRTYFSLPFASMLSSTIGLDLTFTISTVFLTTTQPDSFQGVAGAVASVVVNLGVAVALAAADIIFARSRDEPVTTTNPPATATAPPQDHHLDTDGYRPVFWLAIGLAAAGAAICVAYVRIPRADGRRRRSLRETEPQGSET
jgi:hypothetical protein